MPTKTAEKKTEKKSRKSNPVNENNPLSPSQVRILKAGTIDTSEAKSFGCKSIGALAAKGYVERTTDSDNNKVWLVTPEGAEALARFQSA